MLATFTVMVYGTYDLVLSEHPQIYAFTRTLEDDRLLVILNFTRERPVSEFLTQRRKER